MDGAAKTGEKCGREAAKGDEDDENDHDSNETEITSVKSLLRNFVEDTSIHGVKNSGDQRRSVCFRLLWLLLILTAVCSLLSMLVTLFGKLSTHPFKTVIHVKPTDELPFPAVTICNLNPLQVSKLNNIESPVANLTSAVSAIFLTASIVSGRVNDSGKVINERFPSELLDMTFYNLIQAAFPLVNETVMACYWDRKEENCEQIFLPLDIDIQRCFQFNGNLTDRRISRQSGMKSGLHLLINIHQEDYLFNDHLDAGVQVILHEPGTIPDTSKGFMASPGFSTVAKTTTSLFNYLPAPFKAFGKEPCVEKMDLPEVKEVDPPLTYTHALCHQLCLHSVTQNTCGCRLTETALTANRSLPLCTIRGIFGCYRQNYAAALDLVFGNLDCQCPRLCDSVVYEVSTSMSYFPSDTASQILERLGLIGHSAEYNRKNYVELKIYYDELLSKEIVHVPEYTSDSILGSIGGHMGLFLGASLLSAVELIELLFRLLVRAASALYVRIHRHVMPAGARANTR